MRKTLKKYLPIHTENENPPYVSVTISISVDKDQAIYGQMLGVSNEEFGNFVSQIMGEIIDLSGLS